MSLADGAFVRGLRNLRQAVGRGGRRDGPNKLPEKFSKVSCCLFQVPACFFRREAVSVPFGLRFLGEG